jgi:hypothetical protein
MSYSGEITLPTIGEITTSIDRKWRIHIVCAGGATSSTTYLNTPVIRHTSANMKSPVINFEPNSETSYFNCH